MVTSTSSLLEAAINLINPAYNPDFASYYFPQPVMPSDESSMASGTSNVIDGAINLNLTDQAMVPNRKKGSVTLLCEICGISCNSKPVLDAHLSGKKHRNKVKANHLDTSMIENPLKIKPVEVPETNNINVMPSSSVPGSREVSKHVMLIGETNTATSTLNLSDVYPSEVSEISRPKHLQSITSSAASAICDIACNSKEMLDGDMEDIEHASQVKEHYPESSMQEASGADPAEGSASGASLLYCTICNILSNSQAALETHLAGKKHGLKVKNHTLKVKNVDTLMSLPAIVDHMAESCEPKPVDRGPVTESTYRCTSCNITCNGQATYDLHLAGKKHASKVKAENNHSLTDLSREIIVEIGETKEDKFLEASATTHSPNYCTICNISCNSQDVFDRHMAGKKHLSKVRMAGLSAETCIGTKLDATASKTPLVQLEDHDAQSFQNALGGTSSIKSVIPQDSGCVCPVGIGPDDINMDTHLDYGSDTSQKASKKAKMGLQFAYCAICKIHCTSSELLNAYKLGRKHQRELEKLGRPEEDIITRRKDSTVQQAVASMEYEDSSKNINVMELRNSKVLDQHPSEGNSYTDKRQCVVQSNTSPESISEFGCTVCSVVCNSQIMLDMHLSGKKHAITLWKNSRK